jgi:1-acyl-sn-glycerol-3-phosphate acyltransferase
VLHFIGRTWMRVFGWTLEGEPPFPRKFVFVAAPHTSAWDFPFMMATAWSLRIRIRWLGKHTLFEGPFGGFFRWMGGIAVDRRAAHNLVAQVVDRFAAEEEMILGVPAEGTRGKTDRWRSGFYHMALGANVPVGLGFLDFGRRRAGVGGFFTPTGDVRADMDHVRAFYRDIRGRYPDLACPPRLREEDEVVPARDVA